MRSVVGEDNNEDCHALLFLPQARRAGMERGPASLLEFEGTIRVAGGGAGGGVVGVVF